MEADATRVAFYILPQPAAARRVRRMVPEAPTENVKNHCVCVAVGKPPSQTIVFARDNVALVALANKLARIAWSVMVTHKAFEIRI